MRTIAHRSAFSALALLAALAACESGPPVEPADMVLHNGNVVTVDDSVPRAEAVAVRGYQILAVGSNDEIDRYIGPETEVIDLAGRLMIPGFIESHGHYMSLGQSKMILDLTTAKNFDDIVAMVRDAVASAKPGDWIFGRGWHQEKWDKVPEPNVEGVPLHAALDSVSPDNPVVLTHASGHASFVNGAALAAAGVNARTRNPNGGEIVRDASGNPTGLMRETAQGLVATAGSRIGAALCGGDLLGAEAAGGSRGAGSAGERRDQLHGCRFQLRDDRLPEVAGGPERVAGPALRDGAERVAGKSGGAPRRVPHGG